MSFCWDFTVDALIEKLTLRVVVRDLAEGFFYRGSRWPLIKYSLECREYWMIYRRPGFLAVVWFGSSPNHLVGLGIWKTAVYRMSKTLTWPIRLGLRMRERLSDSPLVRVRLVLLLVLLLELNTSREFSFDNY